MVATHKTSFLFTFVTLARTHFSLEPDPILSKENVFYIGRFEARFVRSNDAIFFQHRIKQKILKNHAWGKEPRQHILPDAVDLQEKEGEAPMGFRTSVAKRLRYAADARTPHCGARTSARLRSALSWLASRTVLRFPN